MLPEVALLLKQFFLVILTLLPIINPLGLTPIYTDMTAGWPGDVRALFPLTLPLTCGPGSISVPLRLPAFILLCIGMQILIAAVGRIFR
jgi:small neutral amino acid transporter SnatA (MarC family)